jgi:hypothetical protein
LLLPTMGPGPHSGGRVWDLGTIRAVLDDMGDNRLGDRSDHAEDDGCEKCERRERGERCKSHSHFHRCLLAIGQVGRSLTAGHHVGGTCDRSSHRGGSHHPSGARFRNRQRDSVCQEQFVCAAQQNSRFSNTLQRPDGRPVPLRHVQKLWVFYKFRAAMTTRFHLCFGPRCVDEK